MTSNQQEMLALELKKGVLLDKVSEGVDDDEEYDEEGLTESEAGTSAELLDDRTVLAENETRLVLGSKLMVLWVLLVATVGCAVATYWFTKKADQAVFETAMEEYAGEAHAISSLMGAQVMGTLHSMSTTITSYARGINATWPYVVVNDFTERGEDLLNLTGSLGLALLPIVPRVDAEKWTNFTLETNAGLPPDVEINPVIHEPLYPNETYYAPVWQRAPPVPFVVNRDFFRPERHKKMIETRGVTLVDMDIGTPLIGTTLDQSEWPQLTLSSPIFESFEPDSKLVAFTSFRVYIHRLYRNILPEHANGMFVVIDATACPFIDTEVTYQLNGPDCVYLGEGDLHDPTYDYLESAFSLDFAVKTCDFDVFIYPSQELEANYKTNKPAVYTFVVVLVFLFTCLSFFVYDLFVERRQTTVMSSAEKTGAIVSSLFPAQFRDRLLEQAGEKSSEGTFKAKGNDNPPFNTELLVHGSTLEGHNLLSSKPLADLFPFVTVMFGDISGFTAWSSVREPAQVFTLLEQIYSSFDAIAKRRKIFKVETIGDCYVAAAGLPEPRDDHAIIMARFATQCRYTFKQVVSKLEVLLGPDTAELQMRFGLHSGPVTAGVLRGEKCRFQLFGDTVNTAARMESTGKSDMIHLSQNTADLLITAGKSEWVKIREGSVLAKGKGSMQTYWLTMKRRQCGSVIGQSKPSKNISDTVSEHSATSDDMSQISGASRENRYQQSDKRIERLVDWNVEVLQGQLKKIVAMRDPAVQEHSNSSGLRFTRKEGETVLDEVLEVIPLANKLSSYHQNPETIILDETVVTQLHEYISMISCMYRDNSFHSFEHASHVTMSVSKLLSRVVTSDTIDKDFQYKEKAGGDSSELHKYTFGITSDPLIHFACALSALIHDVDHTGVPNAQLIKENAEIAGIYRNKSVAEQNSVDLAWDLFFQPRFDELRACICPTQEELNRFRHLVVNCVMATDICDKELGALRKNRWNKAFHLDGADSSHGPSSPQEDVNRKATIVIEHIIQASDVAHTMQHWHVYLKWNERFFHECYQAFLDGRAEKDPSVGWYKGEMGFFDFYIIPLAKKLKDCRVFGVASDEYLNYALANREEWESKGQEVVEGYILNHGKYFAK